MRDVPALVTGGAGYIGSHVVLALADANWRVVVLDDLSTGNRAALPVNVPLIEGDAGDRRLLDRVLAQFGCRAVLHFAGSIRVAESIARPLAYYRNNTVNGHTLIEACVAHGIDAFVFSSTASVYGTPAANPVAEDMPLHPINPYGRSKLMVEEMLSDAADAHGLRDVALRYFNVAGADAQGRTGPARRVRHICSRSPARQPSADGPRCRSSVTTTRRRTVRAYATSSTSATSPTPTSQRLSISLAGGQTRVFNCGYGRGYSVRQVLDTVARISGHALPIRPAGRRPGDAAEVVACAKRIRAELGWRPRHDDLEQIVRDALALEHRLLGAR